MRKSRQNLAPAPVPSMASNADLHRASEMVSSEEDASMGSVWLKGPRRRRFRPNKTYPARTMGAAAIEIDSPAYLASLTCAISMEDRAGAPPARDSHARGRRKGIAGEQDIIS